MINNLFLFQGHHAGKNRFANTIPNTAVKRGNLSKQLSAREVVVPAAAEPGRQNVAK